MPGERGLNRNLHCLQIAHLSDKDCVGILPENMSETSGKSQPYLFSYVNLHNSWNVILNRVLCCNDFSGIAIKGGKGRVESCGLSASCWPGNEENPIWLLNKLSERFKIIRKHPKLIQR